MKKSEFKNQKVECTGDAVAGDYVFFKKSIFSGRYPNATFSHLEEIEGLIRRDSYGEKKQQHTFTIELPSGENMRIKGRNLYRNGCERLLWTDESKRGKALHEKHDRGNVARYEAAKRKGEVY